VEPPRRQDNRTRFTAPVGDLGELAEDIEPSSAPLGRSGHRRAADTGVQPVVPGYEPEAPSGRSGRRRRDDEPPAWRDDEFDELPDRGAGRVADDDESRAPHRGRGRPAEPAPRDHGRASRDQPTGSHARGTSVTELLAANGGTDGPRRRRRRDDDYDD